MISLFTLCSRISTSQIQKFVNPSWIIFWSSSIQPASSPKKAKSTHYRCFYICLCGAIKNTPEERMCTNRSFYWKRISQAMDMASAEYNVLSTLQILFVMSFASFLVFCFCFCCDHDSSSVTLYAIFVNRFFQKSFIMYFILKRT